MDKKLKIGIIIFSIILFLIVLNYSGALSFMNKYFAGTPDKTCAVDSDCVLKRTSCGYCDCGDVVNKDWNVFCPFRKPLMQVMCEMCPPPNYYEIKCIENQCQRLPKNK